MTRTYQYPHSDTIAMDVLAERELTSPQTTIFCVLARLHQRRLPWSPITDAYAVVAYDVRGQVRKVVRIIETEADARTLYETAVATAEGR